LPRACTIDHEALRILQAAGLMADHANLFEPSRGERGGYEFRNGAGELLQAIDWNRAAESGWANTNGFYQPDLEATLEELAVATPGVTVHRGWTFQALTQDDEGVSVELAVTAQPAEVTQVRARWLVGADGANSAVRTELGIEVGDSEFEADWLVVDYQPLVAEKWSAFLYAVSQYRRRLSLISTLATDVLAAALAFLLAYGIRTSLASILEKPVYPLPSYGGLLFFTLAVTVVSLAANGLYRRTTFTDSIERAFRIGQSVFQAVLFLMASTFLFQTPRYSRVLVLLLAPILYGTLLLTRGIVGRMGEGARRQGFAFRRVLFGHEMAVRSVEDRCHVRG